MKKRKSILFDQTWCIGCGACYVACKEENNPGSKIKDDHFKAQLSHNTYTVVEAYENQDEEEIYSRKLCMHCLHPTCVSVCPVGALVKTEHGNVIWLEDRCMGCRYCMQACPHDIPKYEWHKADPDIKKCTLCNHRIQEGGVTACSEACPTEATMFGDYNELLAEAKQRIEDNPDTYYPEIYGLEEAGGTQVLILSSVPFDQVGFAAGLPDHPLENYTQQALEKIPHVVSIGGLFLGGMYWLTKRKNEVAKENRKEGK